MGLCFNLLPASLWLLPVGRRERARAASSRLRSGNGRRGVETKCLFWAGPLMIVAPGRSGDVRRRGAEKQSTFRRSFLFLPHLKEKNRRPFVVARETAARPARSLFQNPSSKASASSHYRPALHQSRRREVAERKQQRACNSPEGKPASQWPTSIGGETVRVCLLKPASCRVLSATEVRAAWRK